MNYSRILVVSNQCFSESTSNGRTLGALFKGWPKDKLRQFCLDNSNPDLSVCNDYFSVRDTDALKACLTLGFKRPGNHKIEDTKNEVSSTHPKVGKSALILLFRNLVWSTGLWKSRQFKNWIDEYKPEIIVFQSGDSAFMADIARKIAKRYNAKIAIYNTEGYVFFSHNYLRHHWTDFIAFPIFKRINRRSFLKIFKKSNLSVYLNSQLEADYQELLPHNSAVIYNSSEMEFTPSAELHQPPTFAYIGNLGIRRPEALAEFAEVLKEVAPECHIDVYGRLPKDYDGIFELTKGIEYHGMVNYDEVKKIMNSVDFLLHVEKNTPILRRELRYAFSTKIADCISSGRNFMVYAPESLACMKYIREVDCAWNATTPEELHKILNTALTDVEARKKVIVSAKKASDNHNAAKNAARFQDLLCTL